MSIDKIRAAFEADWGFTNEEQDCYFIPELNMYGSERVNRAADRKSSAWIYFQKGWKSSRAAIDLTDLSKCFSPNDCGDWAMWLDDIKSMVKP